MPYLKISILIFFCTIVLFVGSVSADWAYSFVVNDGKVYTITDEQVEPQHVGPRIGKVTKYFDHEGTYAGNFSNYYPKGTEYYSIVATDITEAFAVKVDGGHYILAKYGGEYAGESFCRLLPIKQWFGIFQDPVVHYTLTQLFMSWKRIVI